MAKKKKAAKKKVTTEKKPKVKATRAPVAKKATRAASPKKVAKAKKAKAADAPTEKAKTKAKREKVPTRPRRRIWLSVMIKKDEITKPAAKLIKECDDLELTIADASDALRTKLTEVQKALGGASFEHPDRGPMTIMNRGEKTFWRAKPAGVAA